MDIAERPPVTIKLSGCELRLKFPRIIATVDGCVHCDTDEAELITRGVDGPVRRAILAFMRELPSLVLETRIDSDLVTIHLAHTSVHYRDLQHGIRAMHHELGLLFELKDTLPYPEPPFPGIPV